VTRITAYTALTATQADDVLPVVDVHDTSMAASGTTKQITVANLAAAVSGRFLCAPSQYAPGAQTLLTTTSSTMAAVSSANVNTGAFTAPPSGSVMVAASFIAQTSANGSALGFGLAQHGTATMAGFDQVLKLPATTQPFPLALPFLVTGLTPGNSYNFDLMFATAGGGATTVTVFAFGPSGTTPALSNAGIGCPVVMTVQAV
jgi:hypothetical protein